MKTRVVLLSALSAVLAGGCLGPGPKVLPRYTPELPEPPIAGAAAAPDATAPVLVVGRVLAAAAASRRDIVWMDATGRVGSLDDGALAFEPDETVAAALRGYLPGIGVFRAVVPLEVAPRSRDRVMLETWIERFCLERDAQGAVAAVIDARFYLETAPGGDGTPGTLREIHLSARIAVSARKGSLPTAQDAVTGFSKALEALLAKLRIELTR